MKKKREIWSNILEGLLELVIFSTCFGIGAYILSSLSIDSPDISSEFITFIGVIFIYLICSIVYVIHLLFKSKKALKNNQNQADVDLNHL